MKTFHGVLAFWLAVMLLVASVVCFLEGPEFATIGVITGFLCFICYLFARSFLHEADKEEKDLE